MGGHDLVAAAETREEEMRERFYRHARPADATFPGARAARRARRGRAHASIYRYVWGEPGSCGLGWAGELWEQGSKWAWHLF